MTETDKHLAECMRYKDEMIKELADMCKFAKQFIDDELPNNGDGVPKHACDYELDPEKGECTFCNGYIGLELVIKKAKESA